MFIVMYFRMLLTSFVITQRSRLPMNQGSSYVCCV